MTTERLAIGIDIGGTAIKYGICSETGKILEQDSRDTPAEAPANEILEILENLVQTALNSPQISSNNISVIGIGTPGSVDIHRGFLIGNTPNFTHWGNVGISEYLQPQFNIPVFVDNDANLMSFGEYTFGAGKEKENVICITLGTGIGGGIIIDGDLYRGSFFAGSELGHMSIDYKGRMCNCGGIGCWEKYASASAMINDYNKANPQNRINNSQQLFDRYEKNEAVARKILEEIVVYLGVGIANLINIFNPEIIVIGGGVSQAGDWFIEKIRAAAFNRAMKPSQKNVEIRAAVLGNRAGILGASAFALRMVQQNGVPK